MVHIAMMYGSVWMDTFTILSEVNLFIHPWQVFHPYGSQLRGCQYRSLTNNQ